MVAQEKSGPPKKRARRAPVTGAANDCFTCQELQMKCDRRRPYCTQCLERGKSCSGYKTALTWNIGVASRGKLRGLALPIATSEKVPCRPVARGRKNWAISNELPEPGSGSSDFRPAMTSQPSDYSAKIGTRQYSFVNMDPRHPATSLTSATPAARCHSAPQSDAHTSPRIRKRPRRHSSEPLLVPYVDHLRGFQDLPLSTNVLGLCNNHDFGIPVESSPTAAFVAASEPHCRQLFGSSADDNPFNGDFYARHELMGWSRGSCFGLNLDQSVADYPHHKPLPTVPTSAGRADNVLFNQESFDVYGFATNKATWGNTRADDNIRHLAHDQAMSVSALGYADQSNLDFSQPLSFQSGQTNNLWCLVDYYARVVPPVSTTFSSPTHPYKAYILRLAGKSGALQYAIAALSANCMRQRCACARKNPSRQLFSDFFHDEFVRKYPSGHNMLDAGRNQTASLGLGERLEEEFYFKEASSRVLNEQLADMGRRKDDSLRATILILCLGHVCGMGLGKLKRQFAGVTKILSLHGDNSTINFKAMTWLAVMFTWFDSMGLAGGSSKEHFASASMITSNVHEESWRLESLAGCNGKLFNIVTKLGRLNLASGDPLIQEGSSLQAANLAFGQIPSPADNGYDYYSMNANQVDGSRPAPFVDAETDPRVHFWRERNLIRAELEGWQWDPSVGNPTSAQAAPLRQIDSGHVSESFRCAALLYIEWLAFPRMAGMQPHVQTLVKRVLHHVSNVPTDVSLLLPMFIAGLGPPTEQTCHLMGEGCLDMLEDSDFLKNVSALELLQHLWRDNDGDGSADRGFTLGPSTPVWSAGQD